MKFTLVIFAALLCVVSASRPAQERIPEFQKWMEKHGKTYESFTEFQRRLEIFAKNSDMIEAHNQRNLNWTMAVNVFADLEWHEFRANRIGLKKAPLRSARKTVNLHGRTNTPSCIDWTTRGAVTAVKVNLGWAWSSRLRTLW